VQVVPQEEAEEKATLETIQILVLSRAMAEEVLLLLME
jgi:hypothetical protein